MTEPGSDSTFSGDPEETEDREPTPQEPLAGRWVTPPLDFNTGAVEPDGWGASHEQGPLGERPRRQVGSVLGGEPVEGVPAWEIPAKKKRLLSPGKIIRDILAPLAVAFAVAMFTQATVAKPYQIPSGSMLPTIQLHDRILADRVIYHFRSIQHGDIVVFEPPPAALDPDTPFVKRVVGLPGDTIEIRGGKVLVNGDEFVVATATAPTYTRKAETVPEGMLFVLGDNRNESYDSHRWGFVSMDNVIGRAELVYWPLDHLGLLGNG